jgi:hypothetical protein
MTIIIDFYRETASDSEGRFFSEILAWNDDQMEEAHDFIQWLFPLLEASRFNPDAPLLTAVDIATFRAESILRDNLRRSFQRMLAFFGLVQRSDGHVVEGSHFGLRSPEIWSYPNHNWLRITRILKCLTLLGLESEARRFFAWLDSENLRRRFPITGETFAYWANAVNGE